MRLAFVLFSYFCYIALLPERRLLHMIQFIAFSDMLCPYDAAAAENIPPAFVSRIESVCGAASGCRFIATLGNTIDGNADAKTSSCLLNNILNAFDSTASVHALKGIRESIIPKDEFMRIAEYTMRYRAFDVSDYRCIFLDAVKDADGRFYIDDEQLGWISRLLGKSHRPAIIFTNIPLAVSPDEDPALTIKNADALRALIEKSNKVALVLQASGPNPAHFVSHGVPYITLSPMCTSDEASFSLISVSSKGISVNGFGAQESYDISNIFTKNEVSFWSKVKLFFKKH